MDTDNRRTGDKIEISGDYQYQAYYKGSAPQRYWHRFKIHAAIENAFVKPGDRVLDAGCGSGMVAGLIAEANPDAFVIGLDGSAEAIAFCNQQWKHLGNIEFIQSPIDRLSAIASDSIDCIIFLEVIEHITVDQARIVLAEFRRILKKGGRLIISTPNRKSIWPMLESVLDFFKLTPKMKGLQHEKLYSGSELTGIAANAGFILRKSQTINLFAPWVSIISSKFAERIHASEMKRKSGIGPLLIYSFLASD